MEPELSSIMHVDMDAFFLSVELLSRPELRGKPALVAFDAPRSVVLSASYEARARGIRSAMPLAQALRMLPQTTVLEPRHDLYRQVSEKIMGIFASVTPLVEQVSVDEAFLDVSRAQRVFGPPPQIARDLRSAVREQTGLTASIGVARNKYTAKVASTQSKPDGLYYIAPEHTCAFLHPLPLEALWGVGPRTAQKLHLLGASTIGDVASLPPDLMRQSLGENGPHLLALANGIDERPVTPQRQEKSMSADATFSQDTAQRQVLRRHLLRLSEKVASRARDAGALASGVSLRVRWEDFSTIQRSRALHHPTDATQDVFEVATSLMEALLDQHPQRLVRLLSVRLDHLEHGASALQSDLWGSAELRSSADHLADAVRGRFGTLSIQRASTLSAHPDAHPEPEQPPSSAP